MTFSIPQPIPSRSSHPVHAHQRPPIRRSQSHTIATVAATLADSPSTVGGSGANPKFGITHLLASALHPDIGEDLTLGNDDDLDDHCDHDEDDDDESSEPLVERRFDSGHYSSMEEENRGIPIGKPSFLYKSNPVSAFSNRSSNSHLYGTYGSGSVDASAQLSGGPGHPSRRHVYSHSHSNSDGHNSMNVMANNLKGTHSNKSKNQANGGQDATDCINGNLSTNSLGLRATVDHTRNELQPQIPHVEYQPQPPSPQQQMALTEQASTAAVPSLFTPFADAPSSSRSIAIPQQANRQEGAQSVARPTSNGPPTPAPGPTQHPHPIISIDTSKARLIKTPVSAPKDTMATKEAGSAVAVKRAVSISALPRSRAEGQLTLGLRKEEKASTPGATVTAPTSSSTANNSSTRPLMMASQSRLSSALPPTPSYHQRQHSLTAQESVLLPALSPSSPRANSALVTSLEQLSVSWKAPEHTPSFPINRLHRSRTISSGTRPSINSSFSSNGTFGSSNNSGNQYQFQQSNLVSPSTMVTSSSYSSLPYSPAVAFLSNFVDATAPQMAPDEEGEQVGDFIMGKVIGHGGFSIVREAFAIHLDGMVAQVAVKIVKTQTGLTDNDRVQRMLDKEVAIWSRLAHPNVLPFVAVEKLPCSTFVFCELCTGGHLLDYITKQEASSYLSPRAGSSTIGLGETQARLIFNQIAEAVRYLHEEKRIVHRDIKLENILQHEDGTWKICDFGLAEYQNDEAASYFGSPVSPTIYNPRASQSKGLQGSPTSARSDSSLPDDSNADIMAEDDDDIVGGSLAYCSPEQLRSQKPLRCPSSDVWSLGVVLYALLTGRLPFQDEYEPRLQYQILNGRYEDPTECSVEARELLRNMFRSKPEDRWRIGQVMDSPWCMGTMQESCFDDYNNGSTKLNNNFFASFRIKLLPPRHTHTQSEFVYERTTAFRDDKDIALDKSIRKEEEEMLILARLLRSVANDQERMVEVTKQILSVKGRNDDHGVDDVGGNGDDGHHSSGSSSSSSSSKGDTGGNIQDVVLVARVALQLDLDPDSDSTVSGRTRTFRSSSSRKEYSGLPDVLPPPPPSLTTAGYQALPPISDFPLLSAKSLRILQSHNKGKPSNGSGVKKKRFAGGAKSHGGGGGGGETFSSRRGSLDTGSLGTAHKRRASSTGSSVGDDADFSPSQEDNSRGARSFQKTTTTRSGREAVVQGSQDVVMTSTSDNNNAGVAKDHATPLATRTIPGLRPTSKHTPVPKSNPTYAAPASKTPPAKRARRGSTSEPASRASATPVSEISETAVVAEGTPDTNGETSDPDFEPDTCLQCIRAKTRCHGCQRTRKNTWSRCIRCVRHGIRCDPVVAAVAYALDPTLPPMSSLKAPNAVGSMGHTAVAAAASASVVSPIDTMGNVDSTVPTDAAAAMPHSAIADSLDKRRPCTHCKSVRVKCEYLNRRDDGSKDLCRRCIRLHLECVSSDRSRPKDMNPSEVLAPVDLERIKEELWKAGGPSGVDPRDLLPPSVVAAAGPLLSNNLDGEDYQIGKKRQLAFPDGISKANILQHRPRRAAATTATATAGSPPMPRKTSSAAPTRARSEQSGRSKSISSSSTDADLPLENRGAATTITTRAAAPDTTVKDPRSDGDLNISVLAVTGEPDEIVPSARD